MPTWLIELAHKPLSAYSLMDLAKLAAAAMISLLIVYLALIVIAAIWGES